MSRKGSSPRQCQDGGTVRKAEGGVLLRMRLDGSHDGEVHGASGRVSGMVSGREDQERSRIQEPHAVPEGSGTGSVGIRSKLTIAVPVYIERPDEHDGFPHVTCWLPDDVWEGNFGFSEDDVARFKGIVHSCAHLLLEFAAGGRFENV